MIRAQSADGVTHEFPDGTPDSVIDGAMRTYASRGTPKPRRSAAENVTGFMANVNRGTGIGDELAAGFATARDVVTGRSGPNIFQTYKDELGYQREREDTYAAEHPNAASLAKGAGMAATAAVPGGSTANIFATGGRAVNAARGATLAATQGAAYAAADRGTVQERLGAASRAARDPVTLGLGAAAGRLATPAKLKPAAAAKPQTNGQILADIGVSTTIPQRMGRAAKGVEDLGKRAPILGQAMIGYQDRQLGQLNRGVALSALKPVGLTIPKEVKPGFDMVEFVDGALGKVYNRAAKMVPRVAVDDALVADFAKIGERRADLAESEARQFDSIVKDRLNRLRSGEASGDMVKTIHSELGTLQAEQSRKGNTALAAMLGDTRRAVMGLVERANPAARKLVRQADEGWRIYSMMNDAAAAASAHGGIFLPGQLNTQVRRAGKSMGSNMAGKGRGPMQDIATAASQTIPDSYGNPGTANAVGAGSGIVGLITAPAQTLGVAAGLGVAATPYFLAGRKVLEQLPVTASRAELMSAQRRLAELAANDPAVQALQRQVAARLSSAAGVAGGARASQQNIYAQPASP